MREAILLDDGTAPVDSSKDPSNWILSERLRQWITYVHRSIISLATYLK